jgi:hypothetical protein
MKKREDQIKTARYEAAIKVFKTNGVFDVRARITQIAATSHAKLSAFVTPEQGGKVRGRPPKTDNRSVWGGPDNYFFTSNKTARGTTAN